MSKDAEKPFSFSRLLSRPFLEKLKTPAILLIAGIGLFAVAGPSIDGYVTNAKAAHLGFSFGILAVLIGLSNFARCPNT